MPFRNFVRGASPFRGIPDETDILLTITGFAVDMNLSNGMGDAVWGLISEDKFRPSLRSEKPYVPKRLLGLGVSNLYHINI